MGYIYFAFSCCIVCTLIKHQQILCIIRMKNSGLHIAFHTKVCMHTRQYFGYHSTVLLISVLFWFTLIILTVFAPLLSLALLHFDWLWQGPSLKGPKLEIFVDRIFTQIRPVWIGNLGTRAKNPKSYVCGLMLPFIFGIFVLALSATSI
jgi:hypothetical protein